MQDRSEHPTPAEIPGTIPRLQPDDKDRVPDFSLTRADDNMEDVGFTDLFELEEIQRLQDMFSDATGVASIITTIAGTPITKPSNFCRLCIEVIRKTETGRCNCFKSDAALGVHHPSGPIVQQCLSGGLWDGGASITVGGKHVANWLIGQVRNDAQDEERMLLYADEIGADREAFRKALAEVPVMSTERFEKTADLLFTLANELSERAFQNIRQARFIAERQQVEQELQRQNNILSSLLKNLQIGVFMVEAPSGKPLLANDVACELLGRGILSDARTQTLADIYQALKAPENTPYPVDEMPVTCGLRGEKSMVDDMVVVRPDGTKSHLEIHGSPVIDEHGNVLASLVSFSDITERKRAETALRESEQRLQLATKAGKIGVWDWDIVNNEIHWGDSMYSLYEVPKEDFDGAYEAWTRILHPDDRPFVMQEIQAALRGEREYAAEFRIVRPDGTIRIIKAESHLLRDENGSPVRMIGTNRDITDELDLQGQLNQSQKMESVGQLAGGVAHDFNNMLCVILGHTEMVMDQIAPDHPLFASLQEIRNAAEHSADLTRQLLAFARKQTVAPKVIDLNTTIGGMLKMLGRLIGEHIQLTFLPGNLLWPVNVDPSQIDQMLANLCVNARDAIANVGSLRIATVNCTVDAEACACLPEASPGDYVQLSVSDTGAGMDKETISHIFEPFFTTKETGKGTGLGLATVYGIVKQNNGFITVQSEPGEGTTISICLPRHVGTPAPARERGEEKPSARTHETILLVEDEEAILNLTKSILERNGFQVLAANTPDDAIRLAGEHRVDLLVTDVIMPAMNGRDLASHLQNLHPHLKCLFMSGYTADVISQHGVLEQGAFFIQKPFSLHDLLARVREALAG